jgi:hypothetical protein
MPPARLPGPGLVSCKSFAPDDVRSCKSDRSVCLLRFIVCRMHVGLQTRFRLPGGSRPRHSSGGESHPHNWDGVVMTKREKKRKWDKTTVPVVFLTAN